MTADIGMVFVVDDDQRVCEAVCDLLAARGIATAAFSSVGAYAAFVRPDLPGCLLLDVELPDVNGLEFQTQMSREDHPPIVFVTGHGNIQSSVRAMKGGAVDFLTKPFLEHELLNSIQAAFALDRSNRRRRTELTMLQAQLAHLTPRERQVLPLVASGLLNKQAAAELGISEVTLQIHRSKIMRKLNAHSVVDLVHMTEKLGIRTDTSRRSGVTIK